MLKHQCTSKQQMLVPFLFRKYSRIQKGNITHVGGNRRYAKKVYGDETQIG